MARGHALLQDLPELVGADRNGGILGDKMSVPRQAKNCRILAQPIFGRMRETAVIAVTVAVGFWFFGVWSGT